MSPALSVCSKSSRPLAWAAAACVAAALLSGCSKPEESEPPVAGYAPPAEKKELPAPKVALQHLEASVLKGQKAFASPQGEPVMGVEQVVSGQVATLMSHDVNKDGTLSVPEFQVALGNTIDEAPLKALFSRVDKNQDGRIQPQELRAYVEPGTKAADHNRDGYLDASDVSALRKKDKAATSAMSKAPAAQKASVTQNAPAPNSTAPGGTAQPVTTKGASAPSGVTPASAVSVAKPAAPVPPKAP